MSKSIPRKTGWGFGRFLALLLFALLLPTLPASAQLKIGEVDSTMNGTISAGYTGDYGNLINSDHSLTFGGSGTLSGFYYNPNFVSFTVTPYMNQSRDNSAYQSISNASGVNFTSNIFGGSNFPGSISYSKAYNSEGSIAVPGLANYSTHGDSQTFAINWAELVPGLPTLSASFQTGSSQYSIYGANANGTTDSHSLSLRSAYSLAGFNLGAYFSDGGGHSDVPQVVEGSSEVETSNSSSHSFGVTAGHKLPMNGGFSSAFNRTSVDSSFVGYNYNGTIDTYSATASFQPTQKLHYSVSTDYSDNLTGSLYQAVTATGGIVIPSQQSSDSSHAFDLLGNASYSIMPNMQGAVSADYRQQFFLGSSYSAESYGGGVSYFRPVFGGSLNTALSMTENRTSTSSANNLGFSGTVGYSKRFADGWVAGASFSYSQNVETILITYMSSIYSYGGNIRRRWGKLGWNAGANVSKTGLTEQGGITSESQGFNSGLSYGQYFSLTGSYSKSTGSGIESGAGIVITPTPEPVPSSDLILFGGKSWGFGLSSAPMRRLILSATFAKAETNTSLSGLQSSSNTKQINTLIQYQFR
ncbi:MAG: hypothetical protein ACLPND_19665, partial [Candidatus Korobacteraceae bacterium]